MFKPIPGNRELLIDKNGIFRSIGPGVCEPQVIDGLVKIKLYGRQREVSLDWVIGLALYEVNLPKHLVPRLPDVDFYFRKNTRRNNPDVIMVLLSPVYHTPRHRLIPGLLRYAIDKEGRGNKCQRIPV